MLPVTPSFRLDGRRALVTGAGKGIGLSAAAALAQAGAHLVLAARSADEIEAGALAIRQAGGSAEPLALDVSDTVAVPSGLAGIPAFDILVNNAGTNRPKPFAEVTPEDYDVVMELNVRTAFFVAQAVAAGMVAAGRVGSIINMSSQMGHVGGARRTVYCASKAALERLSKAMAIDLAQHRIRVNTICPTCIETPLTAGYFADEAFRRDVLGKIKLGRLGLVEDLMGSDRLSRRRRCGADDGIRRHDRRRLDSGLTNTRQIYFYLTNLMSRLSVRQRARTGRTSRALRSFQQP